MKKYVYSHVQKFARKEAMKIAREMERKGWDVKVHVEDSGKLWIIEYHAPRGESETADYKDTVSPEPLGLNNATAEVKK